MKISDLFEAPISDIYYDGEFNPGEKTSFNNVDKKLFKNPKFEKKVYKAFEKTPFNFSIVFADVDITKDAFGGSVLNGSAIETFEGVFKAGQVPKPINRIFGADPNSITVGIIHNLDFDQNPLNPIHMPMTPWIVAHKIGHGIYNYAKVSRFMNTLHTSTPFQSDLLFYADRCTFKSAKMERLNITELYIDMIAQFLIRGKLILVPTDLDDPAYIQSVADKFNDYFTKIFDDLKNHVIVAV